MDCYVEPWSERQMSPEGDMCLLCVAVLQEMIWPVEGYVESEKWLADYAGSPRIRDIAIGWVDTLIATKQCALCQFLVRRFQSFYPDKALNQVATSRRFFCYIPGGYTTKRSKTGLRLSWNLWVYFQEYEANGCDKKFKQTWRPAYMCVPTMTLLDDCIDKLVDLADVKDEHISFEDLAHAIPAQWDPTLAREALKNCSRYHREACRTARGVLTRTWRKSPQSVDNEPLPLSVPEVGAENLRVIDTKSMRIAALPQGFTYLALSYCWSKREYLCLTSKNIGQLQEPQGVVPDELAPTIADAIIVTRRLDRRFLWVDALCILQDSDDDKAQQIGRMHNVYQGAELTIVGAGIATDDSDPGLPGLRPQSRLAVQDIVELRGFRFSQNLSQNWRDVQQTRWYERAWTYQEFLMSRRVLVFTPVQVRYSCESDVFAEDYRPIACMRRMNPEDKGSKVPCCEYQTPESLEDRNVQRAPNYVNSYEKIVRDLATRQLRFDSDILKPGLGLFTVMADEINEGSLCGLPIYSLLEGFALWYPTDDPFLRRSSSAKHALPSWSWVGWVGSVDWVGSVSMEVGSNGVLNRKYDNTKSFDDLTLLAPTEGGMRRAPLASWSKHGLLRLESCVLCFTAPIAQLHLGHLTIIPDDDYIDLPDGLEEARKIRVTPHSALAFQVLSEAAFAGMLYVDTEYRNHLAQLLQHGTATCDFVELSRGAQNRIHYSLFKETSEIKAAFQRRVREVYQPPCCNVLLVEWRKGVAYRRGVGQIHAEVWDSFNALRRKIKLG